MRKIKIFAAVICLLTCFLFGELPCHAGETVKMIREETTINGIAVTFEVGFQDNHYWVCVTATEKCDFNIRGVVYFGTGNSIGQQEDIYFNCDQKEYCRHDRYLSDDIQTMNVQFIAYTNDGETISKWCDLYK